MSEAIKIIEEKKKINISVSEKLWFDITKLAHLENKSLTKKIVEIIEKYLEEK